MAVERRRTGSQRSQRYYRSAYRKPLGARIKDCCRSTIAFMFSNVGVCGLMVGYTVMGTFLFKHIEESTEMDKHFVVEKHRNETVDRLWNITVAFNTLYPDNWTEGINREILEYQKFIVEQTNEGWNAGNMTAGPVQWSYGGAFLYSLTVITTIGYGHIVPRTPMGKIVTIFYTIFGMPVFLLYMANMGDILAKSLKWVYAKVCICRKRENHYDTSVVWRSADTILRSTAIPFGSSDEFSETPENPDSPSARGRYPHPNPDSHSARGRYPHPNPDSHSARGRYPHPNPSFRHPHHPYSMRVCSEDEEETDLDYDDGQIRTVSGHLDRQSQRYSSYNDRRRRRDERDYSPRGRPRGGRYPKGYHEDFEEYSISSESRSEESRSEKTDLSTVNIPISVSLLIMVALLYGGTKLFQTYETWDMLTSFYFCFISLTTIGFGDYVPGSSVEPLNIHTDVSFIYCSCYLMFGLALLSMCFNLMQEEVVHKFNACMKAVSFGKSKEETQ